MASVYQRKGRPGWYMDYTDALGVNKTNVPITARTAGEAKRFKMEIERTVERQKYGLDPLPITSSMTLAQLCEWWLKDCCPADSEERERSRLETHVINTPLGEHHLHQLDSSHFEVYFTAMTKADQEPGSINRLRSTLGSVFTKAYDLKKWTGANVVEKTKARAVPKRAYMTLKPQEIALVLRKLSVWWRDLFALAFYMGLRKGELFAAHKADVNVEDREITIQRSHDSDTTKGKKAAVLPIPAPAMPYVKNALETFPGELLFPNAAGLQRPKTSKPEVVLRRALKRAGMIIGWKHTCRSCAAKKEPHVEMHADDAERRCPVVRGEEICGAKLWPSAIGKHMKFHELRHSTATVLLRARVPMAIVQRIMRHANIKLTVDLYGHLDNSDMHAAMEQMPDGEMLADALQAAANFPTGILPAGLSRKEKGPDLGVYALESGPLSGAEHQIRTGDLRLGKEQHHLSLVDQLESTERNKT